MLSVYPLIMASSSSSATVMAASSVSLLLRSRYTSHRHEQLALRTNHVSSLSSYPKLALSRLPLNVSKPVLKLRVSASSTSSTVTPTTNNESIDNTENPLSSTLVSNSTRTITSIFAIALALSKVFTDAAIAVKLKSICLNPNPVELAKIQKNLLCTVGPLFFAAASAAPAPGGRPAGYLNTPLTVVAAGLSKWLDIYSGVLMVRVLLSWFPNIPWDKQPLSAIRDLCDPYLNLFRNIIPPIFNTLDISPLLAFAVLGTLGSILNSGRGM